MLAGDCTPKGYLLRPCTKFADDATLYASFHKDLIWLFSPMAKLWSLTASLVKSKGLVVGIGADPLRYSSSSVPAGDDFIDLMEDFRIWKAVLVGMGS